MAVQMKKEANSSSKMSVHLLPIPARVNSRPGKVPRVRESAPLEETKCPTTCYPASPGDCLCCSHLCPGEGLAFLFHSPFLRASVSLLFFIAETPSVSDGSSEHADILIQPLLTAAGTGLWSASVLKPSNWISGLLP